MTTFEEWAAIAAEARKPVTVIEVARRYHFRGVHSVPQLADTIWAEPHHHDYTVEIVALSSAPLGLDTDKIDHAWEQIRPQEQGYPVRMDKVYGAENTTVEMLAQMWLNEMLSKVRNVKKVTVWEDGDRWSSATL